MIFTKTPQPSKPYSYKHYTLLFSFILFICPLYLCIAQELHTDTDKNIDVVFTQLKTELQHANQNQDQAAKVNAHIELAKFFHYLGIENEAITHYHTALQLHPKKDTTQVYIGTKISEIHLDLNQYKNATLYLNKSLAIAEHLNFEKGKATCYALLGRVAEKKSNYQEALNQQEKSLEIFQQLTDSTGLAITYENIGSIYEDLEQFDTALEYFTKAQAYATQSPSGYRMNILNNIADAYRKNGEPEVALPYSLQAYNMAKAEKNTHQEEAALKDLALNYADLGQYETAFDYMIKYKELNASEIESKNTELVSALQILYEVEEREAEVKLLTKQNEVNTIRRRIILLSSLFVILFLIGWLLYFNKRKKQQSKIQHYKNELLQANLDKKTQEEEALQREVDIKVSALTNYSLHLSHKNKMLSDISRTLKHLKDRNAVMIKSKLETLIKDIDLDLSLEAEWTEFIGFFEQIHPDFFQRLKQGVTKELSPSELRLAMLLRLNLPSKEIASILRITPDSVRIARYRLRKKLPIDIKEDLQAYILKL